MIDDDSAKAIAKMGYWDDSFRCQRLYTAWDNIGDEERFFRGVDTLERHGIPARHLFVYMLIGYDRRETWERVLYRFDRMTERGIKPYPMVYGERTRRLEPEHPTLGHRTLADFQRWAIRRYYTVVPFAGFGNVMIPESIPAPVVRLNSLAPMIIWLSLSHGGLFSGLFGGTGVRTERFFKQVR